MIKELEKNERIDKNLLRYVTIRVKKFDLKENYFGKEEYENIKKGKKNKWKIEKTIWKKEKRAVFQNLVFFNQTSTNLRRVAHYQ